MKNIFKIITINISLLISFISFSFEDICGEPPEKHIITLETRILILSSILLGIILVIYGGIRLYKNHKKTKKIHIKFVLCLFIGALLLATGLRAKALPEIVGFDIYIEDRRIGEPHRNIIDKPNYYCRNNNCNWLILDPYRT